MTGLIRSQFTRVFYLSLLTRAGIEKRVFGECHVAAQPVAHLYAKVYSVYGPEHSLDLRWVWPDSHSFCPRARGNPCGNPGRGFEHLDVSNWRLAAPAKRDNHNRH